MRFRAVAFLAVCGLLLGVRPPAYGQWVQTGGPEGCHITSLAATGNRVLAAVEGYGLFMSVDNGARWAAVRTGFPQDRDITCLALKGGTLFAGTDNGLILFSKDDGATWRQVDLGFPEARAGTRVDCLAPVGTDLFISTGGVEYVCLDYAAGAAAVPLDLPKEAMIRSFAVVGSEIIAYRLRGSLFRFKKIGGAWVRSDLASLKVGELLCLESIGPDLIAGTDEGVFLSADKGASWSNISSGLPKAPYVTCLGVSGSSILAGLSELMVPEDPVGILLTRRAGRIWGVAELGLKNVEIECFASGGTHLFAGTTTGIFRSPDGGATWAPVNAGLPVFSNVTALLACGQNLFALTDQGVPSIGGTWLSPDEGRTWTTIGPRLRRNSIVACLVGSGPNILAGISSRSWEEDEKIEGVLLSPNNGMNWITVNMGLPPGEGVRHLAVIGQAIYAATDAGNIFVSTNNGASWDAWGEGLPTRYSISCLVAVGEDLFAGVPQSRLPTAPAAPAGLSLSVGGQYLFAGGPPPTGRLFVRAKGAPKWKDTRIRLSRSVNSLAKIGTALFLGTDSGLYLCENYSQSPKALKLEARFDLPVRCLAMVGTSLVMGTYDGVHIVKADGEKWTFVDTGLPKGIMVSSLAATGTHLFAGTSSEWRGVAGIEERGVWRLPLAALDRFRQ